MIIIFVVGFSLFKLSGIFIPFMIAFFLLEPVAATLAGPRATLLKRIWKAEYGCDEGDHSSAADGTTRQEPAGDRQPEVGRVLETNVATKTGDKTSTSIYTTRQGEGDADVQQAACVSQDGEARNEDETFGLQVEDEHVSLELASSHSSARNSRSSNARLLGDRPAGGATTRTQQRHAVGAADARTIVQRHGANRGPVAKTWLGRLCRETSRRIFLVFTDIFIIVFCLALLFASVFWLIFGLTKALADAPDVFNAYIHGGKVKQLIDFLEAHGIHMSAADLIEKIEAPLEGLITGLLSFLETSVLVVMMLGFFLVASLNRMHPKVVRQGNADSTATGRDDSGEGSSGLATPLESPFFSREDLLMELSSDNAPNNGNADSITQQGGHMNNVADEQQQHIIVVLQGRADASSRRRFSQQRRTSLSSGGRDGETGGDSSNNFALGIIAQARRTVQLFILLKTFVSVLDGALVGILFAAVEVDFWFVFAVLTFLLNYIPSIGGAISLAGPTVFCFLDPTKTFADFVLTLGGGLLCHFFVGNVVEPSLFGNAFEMHPIVILFALVVWGALWGITGAIMSVPLTCCIKLALFPFKERHPYALVTFYLLEFSLPPAESWAALERHQRGAGVPRSTDHLDDVCAALSAPDRTTLVTAPSARPVVEDSMSRPSSTRLTTGLLANHGFSAARSG
ncbi:unnamed protein product [Amoebophrya sp. A25]|nr:unnamed protein product [Amoebophrya sp. A25]|eukprot:GSA25T00005085001.1